jgi:HlyD family secretion protein
MSITAQPAQLQVLAPLPLPGAIGANRPANAGRSLWDEPQADARPTHGMTRAKRWSLVLGAVAVVATGVGVSAYYLSGGAALPQVTTAALSRGAITKIVVTTGSVQPVTSVSVGSQVSGTVSWLGADFTSIVKKGQVIARLDPSLFEAQVAQARSGVAMANANLDRSQVSLLDTQVQYRRMKELSDRQLVSGSDLDSASSAVASAAAALKGSEAQVVQAQASLNQAQVTLNHTVITAPSGGTVTQRSVDLGQTVAASMSSPTIFVIAADLTRMQLNATIDESDIGMIRPGQPVTFSVDAYPGTPFVGTVLQVRLQAVVVSNVTTYPTIIDVPNPEAKLRPGMTATVNVVVASRTDVLRVPNSALRIRPTAEMLAALGQPVGATAPMAKPSSSEGRVWTYRDGVLSPVVVRLGISDGAFTELLEPGLAAGTQVVTALTSAKTARSATATPAAGNPLLGSQPGGGRGR